MMMFRPILPLFLVLSTTGCGAGSLLQSPAERRAELDAAVAEALAAEKGWQTRFVERRSETLLAEQKATAARTEAVEQRMAGLEGRIDDLARTLPSVSGTPRAVPVPSTPAPAASLPSADAEELAAFRRDLDAMTGAVAQLLGERERMEAATRARLERLEYRTSRLDWPTVGGEMGVHLASYRTHQAALAGWEMLQGRHAAVLRAKNPVFAEVDTVAGRYVRLYVGVGLPERELNALRDGIRQGGDYAMTMPLPARPES